VLHDRLLAEPFDRPPLEETEARTVMGVDALLLTPEAALLRGSCHVVSTVARAGVQWMADAWHLLRGSSSFDWDRLLAQAGDGARAAALGGVLGRLVRDLDVEVPGEVLRRLERPSGSACLVTVRGSSLGFRMARRIATLPTALWRRAPR
jgi:hypothetical protein